MKINTCIRKAVGALCLSFAMSAAVFANVDGSYGKGIFLAQAGIGLGFYGTLYGTTSVPPFCLAVDYGATDLVSVGGGIGIAGSKYDVGLRDNSMNFKWSFTYTYIPIMARVAFHPFYLPSLKDKISKREIWDAYGGLALGWTIVNLSETAPSDLTGTTGSPTFSEGTSYFTAGLLLGIRYFFSPSFGVYAEEGSGFGWFNIGCLLKF